MNGERFGQLIVSPHPSGEYLLALERMCLDFHALYQFVSAALAYSDDARLSVVKSLAWPFFGLPAVHRLGD